MYTRGVNPSADRQSSCAKCGCAEDSCASCTDVASCSNCRDCCCGEAHTTWRQKRIRTGLRLEYFSSGWLGFEVVASLAAGIASGSLALLAFGSDSLVELVSALVVTRHLRLDAGGSGAPGRRTAQFCSLLLLSLIPVIGVGAVASFLRGVRPEGSVPGVAIALGAALVMAYLWTGKERVGEQTNCLPLRIDAVESATCLLMSIALLTGLVAESIFGFWWADYLATGTILVFVGREATGLLRLNS